MPAQPSLQQLLRYRFDALLSRGPLGVIVLPLVVTLAFVVAARWASAMRVSRSW